MATTVKVSRWDDSNYINTVSVGNTFTVAAIDNNNRVLSFTPQNLVADSWDNATYWWDGTLASHFTLSQTFTVQSIDTNNKIIYLSG